MENWRTSKRGSCVFRQGAGRHRASKEVRHVLCEEEDLDWGEVDLQPGDVGEDAEEDDEDLRRA